MLFYKLELRWGSAGAYQYLREVEKASGIPEKDVIGLDPETRLANAIRAQDQTNATYAEARAA